VAPRYARREFRFFADRARRGGMVSRCRGTMNYTVRQPMGGGDHHAVEHAVMLSTWKIAPALARAQWCTSREWSL